MKNSNVFISGASSGIGAACAKQFASLGANLILCARRLEKVQEVAATIQAEFPVNIHTFQLDVRSNSAVTKALQALPS